MRTLQQVQQLFPASNVETGLSIDAVPQSRQAHGGNTLTPLPREPLWKKFIEKFDEPIIKILLAAALLSMFVGLFKGEPDVAGVMLALIAAGIGALFVIKQQQWVPTSMYASAFLILIVGAITGHGAEMVEGVAVMVAVILATGVAFLSEYKSDREFELLNAHKEKIRIKVLRDSAFHTVGMEEVVVGDHVVLEMGDEIPADGRLIKATELYVDQSLMTGESEPARKRVRADDTADGPEQPGSLYRG